MAKSTWFSGLGFGIAAGTLLGFYVLAPQINDYRENNDRLHETELTHKEQEIAQEQARRGAAETYLDAHREQIIANALDSVPVAFFVAPDVAPERVAAIRSLFIEAGAVDTGTLSIEPRMINPDYADEVGGIAAHLLPAGAQLSTTGAQPGLHIGQNLSSSLGVDEQNNPRATASDREIVLQALKDQGFLSFDAVPDKAAKLMILITGKDGDALPATEYASQFLADFALGLDEGPVGVVVAGTSAPADSLPSPSTVDLIRKDSKLSSIVSTVDNTDTSFGRLTLILSAQREQQGKVGAYGISDSAYTLYPGAPVVTPPSSQQTEDTQDKEKKSSEPQVPAPTPTPSPSASSTATPSPRP